jgi:hypothetical protein
MEFVVPTNVNFSFPMVLAQEYLHFHMDPEDP